MEVVTVLTAGLWHPGPAAQIGLIRVVRQICGKYPGVRTMWRFGLRHLAGLSGRGADPQTSLCVLYFHSKRDRPQLVAALEDYLSAGGSILAIHGVTASFKGNSRLLELLGGVFSGHGRIATLRVRGREEQGDFTVTDEPYEHTMSDGNTVLYEWIAGEREPQEQGAAPAPGACSGPCAWLRTVGSGTVGYISLGHLARTWRCDGAVRMVRELLDRLQGREEVR